MAVNKLDISMMEDVGTSANQLVQRDGSGNFPAVDGSQLTGVAPFTSSASDPAIDTNPSDGVGTIWYNTTSGEGYVCTDATAGANVWTNIGAGTGGIQPNDGVLHGSSHGYTVGGKKPAAGSWAKTNIIDKFAFGSSSNSTDVGDLTTVNWMASSSSAQSYGYSAGGDPSSSGPQISGNIIQKWPTSTDGNSTDVGDLDTGTCDRPAGHTSSTAGYCAGGMGVSNTHLDKIQKYSFATDGNATDVANLSVTRYGTAAADNTTHGYTFGGYSTPSNAIDRFQFSNDSDATDWADLTSSRVRPGDAQSTTHGYIAGGYVLPSTYVNIIEKFAFASQSNATDVGDTLSAQAEGIAGHSTTTYGYISGPYHHPEVAIDRIERWSFSSDGNSTDVGNLTVARYSTAGTQV